jgi:hypothetical protein
VPEVFVSYRAGDADACATILEQELARRFGADRVGLDAPDTEDAVAAVRSSAVLFVVIGTRWLAFADDHGHNALDTVHDRVRQQILAAFDADVPVVPVLVGRTERLRRVDLPTALARLADCRYVRLDPDDAEPALRELGNLVSDLTDAPAADEPETAAQPDTTVVAGNVATSYQFHGDVSGVAHIGDRFGDTPGAGLR